MTLTTERQQFEEWFTNKYPRSYWGVEKTASGEYQGGLAAPLWEAWKESRGCMANQQAQPVAVMYKDGHVLTKNECGNAFDICCRVQTPLYTAPPAPAVPDEISSAIRYLKDTLVACNRFNYCADAVNRVENACRAAMLAQPVSSSYKLPDNVREALTLALQAMEFMGDTLNNIDAVCTEDVEYVTPAFNAVRELLAAAPEGGNG
ncbi:hypothetical protein [Serratia sp. (in: enterobacteria)]|uniref:hypothetical protein n=1 Tax=Serratia sp. (in: enterobacteria) TaxID=616 RepID=UPI0028BD159F|nr:hypothetical protein [Serratia sp. (in: enterobacteria)]